MGAIVAMFFVVVATVVAELHKPFKNFLAQNLWHHWVGKGIIASVIFLIFGFVLYFCPRKSDETRTIKILWWVFAVTVVGFLAILGFYIYEGLFAH